MHERHFGLVETDVKVLILVNFCIFTSFRGQSYQNSSLTPLD